jgi:isoquinoline 1-oxidoreductase beta subunit
MKDSRFTIDRRDFLKLSAITGGGLLISIFLDEPGRSPAAGWAKSRVTAPDSDAALTLNLYVAIDPSGSVTITVPNPDMGQGSRTALPMILAEELDVDWAKVSVVQAPADSAYGGQSATGSGTVVGCYDNLRAAGATARQMLIAAAAQTWSVEPAECRTDKGMVIHDASGQQAAYDDLAEAASALRAADYRTRGSKQPADFQIVGTSLGRIDAPNMVSGRAVYGSDVRLPGMLYAVLARCPVFGGSVASYDDSAARAIEGVRDVIHVAAGRIDRGVAVVADSTWAAIKGCEALDITWDAGPHASLSTADIRGELEQALEDRLAKIREQESEGEYVIVEATYESPYLAHATMEPMNCTADVRADACEIWAPTQDPQGAQGAARQHSGRQNVKTNVTLSGGGFGRRAEGDFVGEAAFLSQAVGAPVHVVWTREDDIQHDYYRPISMHALRAEIDEQGLPISWRHLVVGQCVGSPSWNPLDQGTNDQFYRFGSTKVVTQMLTDLPIPTGIWRSVYNNNNAFANECFLDEIAVQGGWDPCELRRKLTTREQKLAALDKVIELADWGSAIPAGWGRGFAWHTTWGMSDVAQVVDVSIEDGNAIRVRRVFCALHCGIAVNPDLVAAQMESGIVLGITAALKGEITFENGRTQQSNFHNYPLLRMGEMPEITVAIIPSTDRPQGVGEMSTPPVMPAIANAVFNATGRRLRRMPLRAEDLA